LILDEIDKEVLGIQHDQPFKPSQMPYLKTLASAAVEKAAELGFIYEERLMNIMAMASTAASNHETPSFVRDPRAENELG
jgi:hypothetical protein